MMVSFNAAPALYHEDNGYVIPRQGKPLPDATRNGPIFAQHILNASNKAGHHPRPFHCRTQPATPHCTKATWSSQTYPRRKE